MENGIVERQNEPSNIMKLASQRYLYSCSKNLMGIQLILSIPLMIIVSLFPVMFGNNDFFSKIIVSLSLFITIFDICFFNSVIEKIKTKAAKIQEDFDTNVFSLEWNEIKVDGRPNSEDIYAYSNKYRKLEPDFSSLKSWYPESVKELPLPIGRIICQRTNLWWDGLLRERFIFVVVSFAMLLLILLFVITLAIGLDSQKVLTNIVAPFLPMLTFTLRNFNDNKKAIKNIEILKQKVEDIWLKTLQSIDDPNELTRISRQLQDEIFAHRNNCPLIFDWFYRFFRNEQESSSNYSANDLIAQYKRTRNSSC